MSVWGIYLIPEVEKITAVIIMALTFKGIKKVKYAKVKQENTL